MELEYELLLVDKKSNSQKSVDYLKLNPAGRIPTLIDNGQAIFESSAICIHLYEQYLDDKLIPAIGTKNRALFFQWLAGWSLSIPKSPFSALFKKIKSTPYD